MVSWGEALIYGRRTATFTAISIVALRIHNPVAPANLIEVHPHVHLSAKRFLLPLLVHNSRSQARPCSSTHSVAGSLVPLVTPGHRFASAGPLQSNVLGVLGGLDEGGRLGPVLFGVNHHHDPVRRGMLDTALRIRFRHLGVFLNGRRLALMQPVFKKCCDVENLPGGRRVARFGFRAAEVKPRFGARVPVALTFGVVDVHLNVAAGGEFGKANPQFRPLDGVARRYGGHVECHGPFVSNLLAT